MELTQFRSLVGTSGIPAAALDSNFAKVKPLQSDGNTRHYLLTETPEGWSMRIFPDFPSGTGLFVLGFEAGGMRWVDTQSC